MANLKQQAYSRIKAKVLSCDYAPNSLINEEIICQDLGMSRTPIRDALGRLEQEGLIQILPKKGIMVSRLTFRDIDDIHEIRALLEVYAMRNYGAQIARAALERVHEAFVVESEQGDKHTHELDDAFHALIIGATKNAYIQQVYERMHCNIHRLRVLSDQRDERKQRISASRKEHLAITGCMLEGDFAGAADALHAHLTASQCAAYAAFLGDQDIDIATALAAH